MNARRKPYLLKLLPVWIIALIFAACTSGKKEICFTTREWNEDSLGYHRVVIENNTDADAVYVEVPWRRRDREPWNKAVVLTSGEPEELIDNIFCLSSDNEKGRFVFQAVNGPAKYFLYYLPGKMRGRSNYPGVTYLSPVQTADNSWIELHNLKDPESLASLPQARVSAIQSRNEFNSFFPMEIIATVEEVNNLIKKFPDKTYLLFPEDRHHSIRMY
ncbi:MAG TPA: hypothetical protein ENN86_04755, partial [Desulfobacteraceae bacterium]|nr:hypothetical protein [Desulfobacteraceae bacterium]